MRRYVLQRLGQSAVTLLGVSVLVFVILRVLPGDPARMLLPDGAPESAVAELNRQLGLREPFIVQYGLFLKSVARGDFGQSFQYRAPALRVVLERLPATIQLTLAAMLITIAAGVSLGIFTAVRRGTRYDVAGTIVAVLGQSLPNFWLGIMLILLFGVALRWLPTSGFSGWTSLVLPAITLAAFPMALVARLTRSSMLEILHRDYIRTGRAKGLAEGNVVFRHALRNAAIPVLTVIGLQIGALLGGAVITESVFAWPGMGKLIVDAIFFPRRADGADPLRHRLRRHQSRCGSAVHGHRSPDSILVTRRWEDGGAFRRWRRRHPTMAIGGVLLGLVVFASLLAPALTAYDPLKPSFSQRLAPPWGLGGTRAHLLGDVQLAFPVIMLAIAIVAVVGTNPLALVGVLALSGWVLYARAIRAHVRTIRRLDYIEAATTLGASDLRIIVRHVLPNTVALILVIGSSQFATMVLLESGLSFLGMGIQAPRPSWGLMLAEGRDYLSNAWWLATAPGLMIALVVLGANLLGDGLRDLLDPTLRNVERL